MRYYHNITNFENTQNKVNHEQDTSKSVLAKKGSKPMYGIF